MLSNVIWVTFAAGLLVVMWMAVSYLGASLGGWRDLARKYAIEPGLFKGRLFFCFYGDLDGAEYNYLRLGSNSEGLYLAVLFPATAHPPLFIPWNDIEVGVKKMLFISYATFKFRKSLGGPTLTVMKRVGFNVLRAAGRPEPAPQ